MCGVCHLQVDFRCEVRGILGWKWAFVKSMSFLIIQLQVLQQSSFLDRDRPHWKKWCHDTVGTDWEIINLGSLWAL